MLTRNNLETLTDDNFELYAAKAYTNEACLSKCEFEADVRLFNSVARGLKHDMKSLRLLVNYVVQIFNNFALPDAFHLLLFKVEDEQHAKLKTILWALNMIPKSSVLDSLHLDDDLVDRLRKEL